MEPQCTVYCYDNTKKCKKTNCLSIVAVILLAAFALVIGLLIGAAISATILGALAAIIVLAVVLGILLILTLILIICKKKCHIRDKC